jgi:DNA-binding XRE family transcriptional regulator
MSQETLAEMAEVSKRTVMRIEMGREEPVFARTLKAIQAALEKEGIKFIFEKGVGVGVRVRLQADDTQPPPPPPAQKKRTGTASTVKRQKAR